MNKRLPVLLLLLLSSQAHSFVIWPNASAPCNSTLKACIDASPVGETIEIHTNDEIDETIFTGKTVSLVAGAGYKPKFAAGRELRVQANGPEPVTVKGLTMLDGQLHVSTIGGAPTINVENNEVTQISSTSAALLVNVATSSNQIVNIKYNTVLHEFDTLPPGITGAIMVNKSVGIGVVTGNVYGNTVTANGSQTRGIVLQNISTAGELNMNVSGNTIYGGSRGGIYITAFGSIGSTGSIDTNISSNALYKSNNNLEPSGIIIGGYEGPIEADIVNNTVINASRGIEVYELSSGGEVDAFIANNIVAYSDYGFHFSAGADITHDYNLYFDNVRNLNFTPAANDINVDPQIVSESNGRLRSGSPAIDSGNTFALFSLGSTPLIDADGTYRLKRDTSASAAVDLGAYETGDRYFLNRQDESDDHISIIDNEYTNNQSLANDIHVTSNISPNGVPGPRNNDNEGIYYGFSKWRIFNESAEVDIAVNAAFNVIKYSSTANVFEHDALGGSSVSTIDRTGLNGDADKILMVTQHWTGTYNPHPHGVIYNAGNWQVVNLDGDDIPANSQFNVYYQDPSKSAWEHYASTANISADGTFLDNPLINDQPCAELQVTQLGSQLVFNARPVGVVFDARPAFRKWFIVNQDGTPMLENASFHVMVNPAQIAACKPAMIFRDSFELN